MGLFSKMRTGTIKKTKTWLGADMLKQQGKTVKSFYDGLGDLSDVKPAANSFAEDVQRLQLTEQDLATRLKKHWQTFFIYLAFALVTFVYACFLFINSHAFGGVQCVVLALVLLIFGLRETVKACQIKHRTYQIHFIGWLRFLFSGGKS